MSLKQARAGLSPKARFRGKSLNIQLQEALLYAQSLETVRVDDDANISKMKLATVRIQTLQALLKRKDQAKAQALNKALEENKTLKGEVERLKVELAAALAKPGRPSDVDHIEQVIAKFQAEKRGGQP